MDLKAIYRLLATALLMSGCALDHSNPFDPNAPLTAPNKVGFAYADNVGAIGPTSIELKWSRSTESDFGYYVVARSKSPMALSNLVLTADQKTKIINELKVIKDSDFWSWDSATAASKAPTFASLFNPVAILPDANASSFKDSGLTKSTRYYYAILVLKKNYVSFSVSAEFAIETTPDVANARTCDILFNYKIPGETYDVDIDEVNSLVYVSGYGYNVAQYWNTSASNNFDYFVLKGDIETSFNDSIRGYLWEANTIVISQGPSLYSDFRIVKGFAVDTSNGIYLPELSYAVGWFLYKVTNTTYNPNNTGGHLNYPGTITIDDFSSYLCLDRANQRLYMVGATSGSSNIQIINSAAAAAPLQSIYLGVKTRLNGVCLDSSGNIFVSDSYSNVVYKVPKTGGTGASPVFGTPVLFAGGIGSRLGQFNSIFDVATDVSNNLFVADAGNHRIQKFNSSGQFLTAINVKDLGGDVLASPRGLKYYNNKLYVACARALLEIPLN